MVMNRWGRRQGPKPNSTAGQQRAVGEVQTGLGGESGLLHGRPSIALVQIRQVIPAQQLTGLGRRDVLAPVTSDGVDGRFGAATHPGEPHPQRRMVCHQGVHRHRQRGLVEILGQLGDDGLVEVQQRPVGREEPALDRRQRCRTHNHIPAHRFRYRLRARREFSDGLAEEDVLGGHRYTSAACAGDKLDAQDRVSTELKEVVADPDPFHSQHLRPNISQGVLGRGPWGEVFRCGVGSWSGAGNASRSSFPFTLNGSVSSTTNTGGTM